MSKPTNINELRDQLLDAFEEVKKDPRRANQVKEMVNAAGKAINTLKVQLEYAALRGERPTILFIGGEWMMPNGQLNTKIRGAIEAKERITDEQNIA